MKPSKCRIIRRTAPSFSSETLALYKFITYLLTYLLSLIIIYLNVCSVNLILFTLLLVHLILHKSPHHSHHLRSHHLSLPLPSTPDLKLISFTNPFLHSHSGSIWTAFMDHWV